MYSKSSTETPPLLLKYNGSEAMSKQLEAMWLVATKHYSDTSLGSRAEGWYRDLSVAEAQNCSWDRPYATTAYGGGFQCTYVKPPIVFHKGCILTIVFGSMTEFEVGAQGLELSEPISQAGQLRVVVPVKQQFTKDTPPEIVIDWVMEHEILW